MIQYMEKAFPAKSSGLDKISGMAKAFLLFKQENPEYYCALQNYKHHSGGCGTNSKFLNLSIDENCHINELMIKSITEGIADDSIRKSVIPEKAANAIWGEFNGVIPGFDLNTNTTEAYEYAVELILNGLKKLKDKTQTT